MTQKQTEKKMMTKDQAITNIYTKMHSVMSNAGYVQKEKSKGMPYTFASHNAITEVVSKELQRVGLIILPFVKEHMHDGNQHKVVMAAKIVDIDTKEEIVVGDFPGIGNDNQDKGYGKAISYAYKYILQKLFMLDIGDDEEADQNSVPTETADQKRKMTVWVNTMKQSVNRTLEDKEMTDAEKIHDLIALEKENKAALEKLMQLDKGQWDMLINFIVDAKKKIGGIDEQSDAN